MPESGSQLYHAVFDRRAGERIKSAGQERFRDAVVGNGRNTMCARKRGRGPVGLRPRLQAVRPGAAGGSLSVVHEMTLVQDLCAATHQRGQVLVCVVAAEVQLATRRHRRTNPGASAAGVATIRRIQLRLVQYGAFKSLCVHASITHHRPAPCTPVHPGRNREPTRRHNETGSVNPPSISLNSPRNATHQRDLAPASSIVESVPEPAPRALLATNER